MKITTLDEPFPFSEPIERSPGLHVSDVIRSILVDLGRLEKKDTFTESDMITMERGFVWEQMLSMAWGQLIGARIGEVECEGIALSPDGISFDPDGPIIDEYKCTLKSAKSPPEDNMAWMMQIKAYCYACECLKARLWVWYMKGEYKPPFHVFRVYGLEFTERELVENWTMIINQAKAKGMLPQGDTQ